MSDKVNHRFTHDQLQALEALERGLLEFQLLEVPYSAYIPSSEEERCSIGDKLTGWIHPVFGTRFTMRLFGLNDGSDPGRCGSIGCALGFATNVCGVRRLNEHWDYYGDRIFGIADHDRIGRRTSCLRSEQNRQTALWRWIFCAEWAWIDETPHGAAARIRWILDGKEIPKNQVEIRSGRVPLPYRKDLPPKIYPIAPGFTALP